MVALVEGRKQLVSQVQEMFHQEWRRSKGTSAERQWEGFKKKINRIPVKSMVEYQIWEKYNLVSPSGGYQRQVEIRREYAARRRR
jgi:hypothetical protein